MHKRIVPFIGLAVLIAGIALATKDKQLERTDLYDAKDSDLSIALTGWLDAGSQHTFTNDYSKPHRLTSLSFNVPPNQTSTASVVHYRYIGRKIPSSNAVVTAWGTVGEVNYYTTTNWVKAFTVLNAIVTNTLYTGVHANTNGTPVTVVLTDENDIPDNWWNIGNDQMVFSFSGVSNDYFCANFEK